MAASQKRLGQKRLTKHPWLLVNAGLDELVSRELICLEKDKSAERATKTICLIVVGSGCGGLSNDVWGDNWYSRA
ncbi:hypothetical protein LTR40_002134 [Exophiala xenobiotica]|nr:hypothetical protein LTR40_002134 [Exophiala xenobiotica]